MARAAERAAVDVADVVIGLQRVGRRPRQGQRAGQAQHAEAGRVLVARLAHVAGAEPHDLRRLAAATGRAAPRAPTPPRPRPSAPRTISRPRRRSRRRCRKGEGDGHGGEDVMPGAARSTAAFSFEKPVGWSAGSVAVTVGACGRLAGNSGRVPCWNSLPAAATGTAPPADRARDRRALGRAARRRAVAHVMTAARALTAAAMPRTESARLGRLAVGQRQVEGARAGPDAEDADAVGRRRRHGGARGAVEVGHGGAAHGHDVRAGQLRVGDVDHRVHDADQRAGRG